MIWNNELAEESSSAPAYKLRLPDATLTSVEISETAYPAPDPGEHQLSSGIVKAKRARTHTAGRLGLSILAAVVGTILTSLVNGSPQLKLAAALVGAALPAFVTEPGHHQRQRAVAAGLLAVVALFLTYGGATVFSYAAHHAPIYPGQPAPKQDRQASHPGVTAPSEPGSGTVPGSPGSHPRTVDLSRLSPSGGSADGGDTVTITGAGFTGVTAVNFGGTPAQNFTIDSGTQITAISPPGDGTVDVTVVTPDGTTPTSPADQFTYATVPPSSTSTATPSDSSAPASTPTPDSSPSTPAP